MQPSLPLLEVLVTRPEPGAARTKAALRARGFAPVSAAVLAVEPLSAKLPPPAAVQAVLVTSAQALPALPPAFRDLPLLAVGAATAAAATRRGHVAVHSADSDAQALAALAGRLCCPAGLPLLLASGAGQGIPLTKALQDAGFDVAHREVYAARPVAALPPAAAAALRAGRIYAATFFSAETARVFAALADRAGLRDTVAPVVAVAIGAPAAQALAVLPWRSIRVAARPTQDELLALL